MEELNLTSSVVGINLSRTTYESTPFRTYYLIGIPILIATALVAFLVNSYILLSSRWIRKKMSPNLKLSISLAAADAFTSVLMVIGLVINSYLPIALGKPRLELNCLRLFLESLRIGAIETSVIHLLVLSLNQLLSIRYPLHYSRLISARKVHWVILGIWLFPTVAVGLCFSIYGYNATNCWTEAFVELQFRLFVFILVFAPFMLLMIIYILLLISLRQAHRSQAAQQNSLGANQLKRSFRMATTTSLIIGTFATGWLPSAIMLALVCKDCLVDPLRIKRSYLVAVATSVNVLMVLKLLLNPLIYAYRILEIRFALWIMHKSCWGLKPDQNLYRSVPNEFQKLSAAASILSSSIYQHRKGHKSNRAENLLSASTKNSSQMVQSHSRITFDSVSDTIL